MVEAVDDEIVESDEEFLLLLSSEDAAVLITTSNVTVLILDNDGELVHYCYCNQLMMLVLIDWRLP